MNMIHKPYTFSWAFLKNLTMGDCAKLIERLNDTLQVTSNNMETQQVGEIRNLIASFPTSVLTQLQNLEKLAIHRCSSLEVVFDHQGLNAIQLAGAFEYLNLLIVEGCDSLRHVFTPSIAKLLSRLQTLEISNCENLGAIVAKEEEDEEEYIVEEGAGGGIFNLFPQLTSLSLEKLPKLFQITPKAYTFNWPSLKNLTLVDCEKLIEIMYDTLQLQHLEELEIQRCSSLEVVFDLQGLNVVQLVGAFQYLRSLTVEGCDSLRHVFTPSTAKLLSRLQTLEISNCENLEAVVAKEEEDEEEYIMEEGAGGGIFNLFPQLTSLSLEKLPKLLHITPKAYTFNKQSLKKLTLADCGKLTETLYNTLQLQHIDLRSLPKLRHVWKTSAHVIQGSFKNLTQLYVEHCESLKDVFTPSVAKLLLALRYVRIVECENLEAIVANEYEEEECRLELEGGGGINVILFPQLYSLYLHELQNLLTITPKPYTFNRSSLRVFGCDKLQDIH
ncbi:hypothetical protein LguiA_017766 [Lonicera macranthoides]